MKTDWQLKAIRNKITTVRAYDDELSDIIRLEMIQELATQIKVNSLNKQREN